METRIVEAGNGFNWGKFMVMRPDEEWGRAAAAPGALPIPVLAGRGWAPEHIIVFDLETCEGAAFSPGGMASADLHKHRIWVCPMFEPFLEWLYQQPLADLSALPDYVNLPDAPSALAGYRRPGDDTETHVAHFDMDLRCSRCGRKIKEGDEITKIVETDGWDHVQCHG